MIKRYPGMGLPTDLMKDSSRRKLRKENFVHLKIIHFEIGQSWDRCEPKNRCKIVCKAYNTPRIACINITCIGKKLVNYSKFEF